LLNIVCKRFYDVGFQNQLPSEESAVSVLYYKRPHLLLDAKKYIVLWQYIQYKSLKQKHFVMIHYAGRLKNIMRMDVIKMYLYKYAAEIKRKIIGE
jgi:hypothetical protein